MPTPAGKPSAAWLPLLASAVMLTSCVGSARVGSNPPCPSLVAYDEATQEAAAVEVESGTAPVLSKLTRDYADLRAQIRAVCK